jgi:geranylgeranyl diphosphate synthase type II
MDPMANTLASPWAEYAERLGPPIDAALSDYTDLSQGCPPRLREAMRYSLLAPGKRLRPMLALLAADACGGDIQAAMPAACAVEMVHAYSLIHDDLPAMDDDDLRRGRPTCHKVFGEALAILAGDALLALAFEVLASGIRPPAAAAACCASLAVAAGPCQLVGGQADDIEGEEKGDSPHLCEAPFGPSRQMGTVPFFPAGCGCGDNGLPVLESIHGRKTGALIRVSLRLGALTVAASHEQLAALDEYGRRLGLAFQITDDLLDVRSDEATAGKRVGKDAAKGKLTFPGLLGVEPSAACAERLVAEACGWLAPLGPAAAGLELLARQVLQRSR